MEQSPPRPSPLRQILTAAAFFAMLAGLTLANLLYTPPEISLSERRKLATLPPVTREQLRNGRWMKAFESYTLDSFVYRDSFRRLKAMTLYNLFGQTDNNGIYLVKGTAASLQTMDEAAIYSAAEKLSRLLPMVEGLHVYYTIIPDKGEYLAHEGYPVLDYDRIETIMSQALGDIDYINLREVLDIVDYYQTDLHWEQSRLKNVVTALGQAMGFEAAFPNVPHLLEPFYGVYYGQSALPLPAESLTYLTGDAIDSAVAAYLNADTLEMEAGFMYYPEKLEGVDPYDVFLGGAQPLITIDNPHAATERQLYLFRDSFSSSLAPLLVSAYRKITLIDLRYIAAPAVAQLVDFAPGSDVLFAYGGQILNSSGVLLVP